MSHLILEAMISKVGSKHKDTNDSENAELYDAFREMPAEELAQEFLLFEPYLLEKIKLSFNQTPQKLEVQHIDIPDVGDLELARDSILFFKGRIPDGANNLNWQWDKSFGNAVLRVSSEKQPELFSAYLLDGKASGPVTFPTTTMANSDCNDPQNLQKEGGCQNNNLSAANSKCFSRNSCRSNCSIIIPYCPQAGSPKAMETAHFSIGSFCSRRNIQGI